MPRHAVSDLLLHNFPENGVKFLLHNPGNLRDVMAYLAARYRDLPDLGCFDFARRTIEPDTLIRSDFSHGVTDLLVRLPFRSGREPAAWIKMYLLVEQRRSMEKRKSRSVRPPRQSRPRPTHDGVVVGLARGKCFSDMSLRAQDHYANGIAKMA